MTVQMNTQGLKSDSYLTVTNALNQPVITVN